MRLTLQNFRDGKKKRTSLLDRLRAQLKDRAGIWSHAAHAVSRGDGSDKAAATPACCKIVCTRNTRESQCDEKDAQHMSTSAGYETRRSNPIAPHRAYIAPTVYAEPFEPFPPIMLRLPKL